MCSSWTVVPYPCWSCCTNATVEGGCQWSLSEVLVMFEYVFMIFCYNAFYLLVLYFVTSRFGSSVERLPVLLEILTVLPEEVSVLYVVQSSLSSDVFRINMTTRDNLV